MNDSRVLSPSDAALRNLADELVSLAGELQGDGAWPGKQLALCGEHGVFEWFVSPSGGGQGWSEPDIYRGYLELSAACLTTAFVITQRTGASRRIEAGDSDFVRQRYLSGLVSGEVFATVGISHLTTSRRHLAKPVLRAERTVGGFLLDGFSPWVTGAASAEVIVTGATLEDGEQLLFALPMDIAGVAVPDQIPLIGLSASQTGPVRLDRVKLDDKWLLAGPMESVMSHGIGAKPGGLQTSTLALGLTNSAISFLEKESLQRQDLAPPAASFREQWNRLRADLLAAAAGNPTCSNEHLRTGANQIVLRATQAALAAAKGAGYVVGHPAGRWCQEALFFLVWSCPQPVMAAQLCELAGIEG